MTRTHAFQLLPDLIDPSASAGGAAESDVVAVFGTDATLRSWTIHALTADSDCVVADGETARWIDLHDDLATASLFDIGNKRTVIIRGADKFVSSHRPEIEAFIAKPSGAARLILELESLATNTRIYKGIDKDHLLIGCSAATDAKAGVAAAGRRKFLTGYVAGRHQCKLATGAADALLEMLGDEIGMIDTEIAKLALYVEPGGTIDETLVREVVAGWQGQTIWQITDAIAAGNAAEAIKQLDKLMTCGQRPIALLPQIAWSLRKLGMATAIVEHQERVGRKIRLEDALASTGLRRPADIGRAKSQLQRMRRHRGKQLLAWLLDVDLRLKGTHSSDGRDRFLLEQLVMRLAKSESTPSET